MRSERKQLARQSLSKPFLTCLLSLLVLAATVIATNPALHRALHQDETSGVHACLACSIIHGDVAGSAPAIVLIALLLVAVPWLATYRAPLPDSFFFSYSSCRAPPRA
jgi:hypothetical protein